MIHCPYKLRPRDFESLEWFAEENPALAEYAENVAWSDETFSWSTFFAMLREFKHGEQ